MTDFPTILYRIPGPHKKPRGGTYAYQGAADQAEFDTLIAKGWFPSYEDAASKLDKKPKAKAVEIDEVSAPSREELEIKAKELGVSFNSRTSAITLSDRITSALEV
tara:strand:- start:1842 stop:2159 length:318 start_codon:yes stop_codon:yes gene_type:complete